MLNRLFISPVRLVAWAGVAVAFVLALVWLFDIAPQRNQTGASEVTRIVKEPMVEQVEVTRVVKETVIEVVEVTPVFDAEAEKEALESLSKVYYDTYEVQEMQVHKDIEDDGFELFAGNFNWQGILTADDTGPDPGAVGTKITVDSREWMIAPQLAVARSRERWVWPDGSEHNYLLTMVWEKKDGQWYLVHAHMSEYEP